METHILLYLLVVPSLCLVLHLSLKAFYSLWWKPRRLEKQLRQQGIRCNPYKILYGDLKEEIRAFTDAWSRPMDEHTHQIVPRIVPYIYEMVQKHGKNCLLWTGPTPNVLIWDPDTVKAIFSDKSGRFMHPPVNPLVKMLGGGLAGLEGEEWAKRRKIITPAFHAEKLKRMGPAFLTSCNDLIRRWDDLVGVEGSCELDVWPEFQNLTGDAISRTAFGSNFEEGKRIFQLQKEQGELVTEAAQVPYIPGYRFIPTAKNKRRMWVDKEIVTMLRAMIDRKIKSMENEETDGGDLLGLLLQCTTTDDHKNRITIEEVIDECKLFYFAGQETTSTLLTWTLVLLSMHPVWQERSREEVLRTIGKNAPDVETINHLKIVTMVLNEVLRLYPPVSFLFRHTYKETRVGDLSLAAGVGIMLPIVFIHHDKEIWGDDAEEFNPERFSEGISKASKRGQSAFLPFGWGPRICLGQSFAMIEAKIALATILQKFSFELSPSYAHAPYSGMTLQPQHGAHIILHRL